MTLDDSVLSELLAALKVGEGVRVSTGVCKGVA